MISTAISLAARPRDDAAQQPAERLVVNKSELAKILDCSRPTLHDLIAEYPDFPVVQKGSTGVEWQFDAAEVVAFLPAKRDAERREAENRAELFRQFTLPIDGLATEPQTGVSGSQRLANAKALLAERQLALETGLLLQASEVRQMLQGARSVIRKQTAAATEAMGETRRERSL